MPLSAVVVVVVVVVADLVVGVGVVGTGDDTERRESVEVSASRGVVVGDGETPMPLPPTSGSVDPEGMPSEEVGEMYCSELKEGFECGEAFEWFEDEGWVVVVVVVFGVAKLPPIDGDDDEAGRGAAEGLAVPLWLDLERRRRTRSAKSTR